jgi:3-phenylpropionate/trans-cinnamate dioxygenase ferredoxin reductase subunit
MPVPTKRCVVVGGSLGGLRAAEAVGRTGFDGELVVFGAEPHMPYNRPPLSKAALEDHPNLESLNFRISSAAREISWRLGQTVKSVSIEQQSVILANGKQIEWDGLVVASGVSARRLDLPGPALGRYVVRTATDAIRLRQAVYPGSTVVVLGAGFIGCEVASTCRSFGAEVRIVAPEAVPMQNPLGLLFGHELQRRHERHGVQFHMGSLPVAFEGGSKAQRIQLSDGTVLKADVVVESVGTTPNTEAFEHNGLDLTDGVLCNNHMQVQDHPKVVACGDVARFPNPLVDSVPRRVEHWNMAVDTARRAGKSLGSYLLSEELDTSEFQPMPSFWSDQYDMRIQSFGMPLLGIDDVRVLEGDLETEAAVGYHRDESLVGVVLLGLTARHSHYRSLIAQSGGGGAPRQELSAGAATA